MDATVEHMEVCPDYVTCKCPTNHIKLTLPIYVSPSGMQVACSGCHAAVEECAPAPAVGGDGSGAALRREKRHRHGA